MGLKEDIGPWSNLKRSEWYRSGGGHNFWLVIIIAHAFQIIIVMIQIVHFIQVELRAAFTSAHHPCKAAIIDFKHSNFRTNSTLVNCLKFRQWYMMDGKRSYIILYHPIPSYTHTSTQRTAIVVSLRLNLLTYATKRARWPTMRPQCPRQRFTKAEKSWSRVSSNITCAIPRLEAIGNCCQTGVLNHL